LNVYGIVDPYDYMGSCQFSM